MEKENILPAAILFVLDIGLSKESDALENATFFIQTILNKKMKERSRDEVCLVLCGATGTVSPMEGVESYKNITIARRLGTLDHDFLDLVQRIKATRGSGNCIEAVVMAMDYVDKAIRDENKMFASKKMLLLTQLTDFGRKYSDDQMHADVARIKKSKTKLAVIDLMKYKTEKQRAGQDVLDMILQDVNGLFYSLRFIPIGLKTEV